MRRAKKFFDDSDTENDSCESSQCQDGDTLKDSFFSDTGQIIQRA